MNSGARPAKFSIVFCYFLLFLLLCLFSFLLFLFSIPWDLIPLVIYICIFCPISLGTTFLSVSAWSLTLFLYLPSSSISQSFYLFLRSVECCCGHKSNRDLSIEVSNTFFFKISEKNRKISWHNLNFSYILISHCLNNFLNFSVNFNLT